MKKLIVLILIILCCLFTGCYDSKPYDAIMSGDRFVITSERTTGNTVYVEMYDKNTKVMYVYIKLSQSGSFCPLIDENGKPLLYGEN